MQPIATTPEPPYYAVIFTSKLGDDDSGYAEMASEMVRLAEQQDGFLGIESAREEIGITVSYWRDLDSIERWRANARHQVAQTLGKNRWYEQYSLRVALVERAYGK